MNDAQEAGVVNEPVQLASNVMVMVVPSVNAGNINSIEDITDESTFVLCDPQVPCGTVSESIIESKGLDITADSLEHQDRKSTRLNSSHVSISYAVFCLKKKKRQHM